MAEHDEQEANAWLLRIAARPRDRELRALFADWLLDRGDPRGEVISLSLKDHLSLTERRRVLNLTEQHGRRWLGPFGEVVDRSLTRFVAGFPTALTFAGLGTEPIRWTELVGDVRLATVESLTFPQLTLERGLRELLEHPVLAQLERLAAPVSLLEELGTFKGPFTLSTLGVASWGVFRRERERMFALRGFAEVPTMELLTGEFISAANARAIRGQIAQPLVSGSSAVRQVCLVSKYGALEGVIAWLLLDGERTLLEHEWTRGDAWAVSHLGVRYTLRRGEGGGFTHLELDPVSEQGTLDLSSRLAGAFSVLAQLGPAKLQVVDVSTPRELRLTARERDELRAAARRLRGVTTFKVAGEPFVP